MTLLKRLIARLFTVFETGLDRIFGPSLNPFNNLGALGFLFFWVVTVSGLYLYIFFDTGVTEAFDSVEYLTHEQWYAGGIMRSLHRYASDGMVLVMVLHILREFSFDRYRGVRWFSWITGVPILWFVIICGLTGYWLVWDTLAQYIAITSTEWLDWLPIFGEPIARNFIAPGALEDRFFSLLAFMHIAAPLVLLILLWVHLNRVTMANWNPPRGLSIGVLMSLFALSIIYPAVSQGAADLAIVPSPVGIDWFYLPFFPLLDIWPAAVTWGLAGALTAILVAMPWLPPLRRKQPAAVNLTNCNGCNRCVDDCPFFAIQMVPRTDGLPFEHQAEVDTDLCTSCGICAGSCPTSTPFRRRSGLVPGIELPDYPLGDLRDKIKTASQSLSGEARILVIACSHSMKEATLDVQAATVQVPCISMLPPSFVDYALSRELADGVLLSGCRKGECYYRLGPTIMEQRIAGERDPRLPRRVPRQRVDILWSSKDAHKGLAAALCAFSSSLEAMNRDGLHKVSRRQDADAMMDETLKESVAND